MKDAKFGCILAICCFSILIIALIAGLGAPDDNTSHTNLNDSKFNDTLNSSNLSIHDNEHDSSDLNMESTISESSSDSSNSHVYVASVKSNKFHYENCRWAHKIKSSNLITFNSREEAINAGYSPCKVCCP